MKNEISTAHLATLEQLLLKPWEQGNNQLMTTLERLCRFYDDGDMTEVELNNLNALSKSIKDLYDLQNLLEEMNDVLKVDFFQGLEILKRKMQNRQRNPLFKPIQAYSP